MSKPRLRSIACGAGLIFQAILGAPVAAYREKRDLIYNGLKDRFSVTRPGGAFYIFPEAPNGDGDAFVTKAIENNLLIIPGSVFSSAKTHFRISFASTNETLQKGLDILHRIADQ